MISSKHVQHEEISARLSSCSDADLLAQVESAAAGAAGVGGGTALLDVGGTPVFVKRIPLTDQELARPLSTANLFELPLHCQYGIGGPGFNAWRELAANTTATAGVLAGRTNSFPLLHHWRVLPGRAPLGAEHTEVDAAVAAMGGSTAVRARFDAMAAASCSLVLFFEHLPGPLLGWLREDPVGRASAFDEQLSRIVAFLRARRLLHMDGHFGNMRTDGERIYLADFGLALSPRFELSAAERRFARRHVAHDADHAAMRLVNWLVTEVCGVQVTGSGGVTARNEYVLRCASGHISPGLPPVVSELLARHAPAAARMNAFYWRLFDGDLSAEYLGPPVAWD
ncbi:hypothetical protein SAMN05421805_1011697 [Saccharopolyspora antimicrobica]|uniref:Serine/threonine protein phosphatase n=1 Tax=Saccharopolyspora antimicrobica TaxID=455193 RepID=A0A1I4U302_9PSEU|nr:serine/threonine protein phosphatase [Saccharopolyspora antimicrobica]RKT88656.1 hypothetical protein ATL45_7095 [Saccharopolyspora antimicrobica]SFM83279.1 hypothetical protein SAMN05421805_1011697 [Saccharopolyspora antimicrobica]